MNRGRHDAADEPKGGQDRNVVKEERTAYPSERH